MLSWKSLPIPNVTFLFQLGDESQLIYTVSGKGRACGRCGCFVCSVLTLQLTWSPLPPLNLEPSSTDTTQQNQSTE